jgi:hypothetical protein
MITILVITIMCLLIKCKFNNIRTWKNFSILIGLSESELRNFFMYRPIALTSQILRVSSRCSLTISVWVQQPHTAQKLTILIQNYCKVLQNLLCLQKLYRLLILPPDASSLALWRHVQWVSIISSATFLKYSANFIDNLGFLSGLKHEAITKTAN